MSSAPNLTQQRIMEAVASGAASGRIVSLVKALGMTNIRLVSDQGEYQLPEGDYLMLMLSSRAAAPVFGAEMAKDDKVGSTP